MRADIIELIKLCRQLNVHYLEYGSLKVNFDPKPEFKDCVKESESVRASEVPDVPAETLVKPMSVLDEMSPEEILYYATPYYDEIQAKKQNHEEALKEEKE